MHISEAQREVRAHFAGGAHGQFVSGLVWLSSAVLATWSSPRAAITMLVVGGVCIFPATVLLLRVTGVRAALSAENTLRDLGWQVAFVLPLSMPLLLPVGLYHLNWFYPAMMILLGAHYLPFTFMYGRRMFAVLAAGLVAGGVILTQLGPSSFSVGAWYTAAALFAAAAVARASIERDTRPV